MVNHINALLEKYKHKMVFVDTKKDYLEIIKQLVDIKEHDLNIINAVHLNLIQNNIQNSVYYDRNPINLHFFEVRKNARSFKYYSEISQDSMYMYKAYFEEPTVYFIYDESIGVLESNSTLLINDSKILRGITQEDINSNSFYLNDYLSIFHAEEEM